MGAQTSICAPILLGVKNKLKDLFLKTNSCKGFECSNCYFIFHCSLRTNALRIYQICQMPIEKVFQCHWYLLSYRKTDIHGLGANNVAAVL